VALVLSAGRAEDAGARIAALILALAVSLILLHRRRVMAAAVGPA